MANRQVTAADVASSVLHSQALRLGSRRLLQAVPVLVGVTLLTFALLNLLPGDTAQSLLGMNATPASLAALSLKLHLNEPFFVRYWGWLHSLIEGHFGTSLASGQPVSSILAARLPVSLEIVGLAFLISLSCAIPVAIFAARKPRGLIDKANISVSMFGLSTPNFVFGLLLILVLAVHVRIFPAIGFVPISKGLWANVRSMILPACTIAFGLFCAYTRVLRGEIVEQMVGADYIVTAKAKGLPPREILVRHALRNSIFGLLTLVGLNLGTLIGGTVIVEQIFALPGLGQELLQAIDNRDVIVVEDIVTLLACAVVLSNFVTDLLYSVLDPRIRLGRRTA